MQGPFVDMKTNQSAERILFAYLCSRRSLLFPPDFVQGLERLTGGQSLLAEEWWAPTSIFGTLAHPWRERVPRLLQQIQFDQEQGIHFTFPGQADYPNEFQCLYDPPWFLSYVGHPVWSTQIGLSVVGSREPGRISESWCEQELPHVIRRLGLYIVSGGARGVDQIAHRVALRENVPTVVFVPSGLRQLYPETLQEWVSAIVSGGGALVSEYAPRTLMRKHYFSERNRLISGLGMATLVVEARKRSGTLLTAKHCVEQGKPLFVLPSHPLDPSNRGALDLMMEGATPVCSAEDLVMMLSGELSTSRRGFSTSSVDSVAVTDFGADETGAIIIKSENF